jgi:HK97 family phage major capsid protein
LTVTTFNSNPILRPDQVYNLLVRPVQALSVALNPACATVVPISTKNLRAPVVTADPQAAWVAEAAEIPVSDTAFTEVDTTPGKVAGLTLVTRELADDSSPAAALVVGQGLARDIARQVDAAFLGNIASPAPAGLGSLPVTAGNVQVISAGATPANLDAFAAAIAQAAAVGARITSFILHPTDALAFAKIKSGTGFNTPLLQPDPTQPTRSVVFGVPMLVSPQAAQGVIWGLAADRILTVLREDATVETDRSVYFTSDRVAVKGVMRIGFAFLHNAAVVKINLS